MRWFVWSVLLFAAAVAVALFARASSGNVAILWPPYRVDVSVNLVLLLLLVGFVVLHLFLVGLRRALDLPARVREYRERRRSQLAVDALRDAMLAYFEGRFGRAERLAQATQGAQGVAGAAALVAARAAHRLREGARRDAWLARADGDERVQQALQMTRAELAVEERQSEAALEAIASLQARGARHIQALRVALRAYEQAGDWPRVLRSVRSLDKRDALHPAVSLRLRITAYRALLASGPDEAGAVKRLWADIPERDRAIASVAEAGAAAFERAGDAESARRTIEAALDREWSARLAARYVRLEGGSSRERLAHAEQWRMRYPEEPTLLLALGELCLGERLWGKATDYLQQALHRDPHSAAVHLALAHLHEALGESGPAALHWRASALAAAGAAAAAHDGAMAADEGRDGEIVMIPPIDNASARETTA